MSDDGRGSWSAFPDDEREVDLADESQPLVPPTVDAEERVELSDDDGTEAAGDGPASSD
ncbi:hypothetical protein N1028_13560 [Herbiconiux sp. CPCC 203407]|uniref:Uncharacterized protein n=1 Tax=Herbiconiux oxytropis TaxID=2970915 RepID=A0AA42BUH8_9MICO|nr:hypothetical protein [Herbiconiux oxytropis]MCS5724143.1 hypothetical protein [Herbiconiux oxytropis]MCS5726922.1 hypothetical protein [Herbiconiux oxytropis]